MKKNLSLPKGLLLLFVMILALFLTACGSSSTTGDGTATYDGLTDPAVITAANAEEIASKAVGADFLGVAALTVSNLKPGEPGGKGPSSPEGHEHLTGLAGVRLLHTYEEIVFSDGLPLNIPWLDRQVCDHGFPTSGSFEDTLDVTIGNSTVTIEGDLIFDGATMNVSEMDDSYATYDGTISLKYVFDTTGYYVDADSIDGEPWDYMSPMAKLVLMLNRHATILEETYSYSSYKSQSTTTSLVPESEDTDSSTVAISIDGDFTRSFEVTQNDLGYTGYYFRGTNSYYGGYAGYYGTNAISDSIVFSGTMVVTEETTATAETAGKSSTDDLDKIESSITVTLTDGELNLAETVSDTYAKPSDTELTYDVDCDYALSLSGDIAIEYSYSSPESAVAITAAIEGEYTENETYDENIDSMYIDEETPFRFSNQKSRIWEGKWDRQIAGSIDATITTTEKEAAIETDVFQWITETTDFEMKNGIYTSEHPYSGSITKTWTEEPEDTEEGKYMVDPSISNGYYTTQKVDTEQKSETDTISGYAKISRDDNYVEISGEFIDAYSYDYTYTGNYVWNETAGPDGTGAPVPSDVEVDPVENYSKIKTLNNVSLSADSADLKVQGTIETKYEDFEAFRSDFRGSADRYIFDLIIADNVNSKSYMLESYIVLPDGPHMSIDGRFYHSDYGYVDVVTGSVPFAFFDYMDGIYAEGEAKMTGADGTSATLTLTTDDDYNISYSIEADTDADGANDAGPFVTVLPDAEETLEGFWLYDAASILGTLAQEYHREMRM